MKFRLTKDFTFEAAQTLPHAPEGHKCRRMHGHSFKVEVTVEGERDPVTGWFYDHADISKAMRPLLELMDHGYLNEIPGLENPTIENMCAWFGRSLRRSVRDWRKSSSMRRRRLVARCVRSRFPAESWHFADFRAKACRESPFSYAP